MDVLGNIMQERIEAVAVARAAVPEAVLEDAARTRVHHSLGARLREGMAVIAEVKRASPSAGILRPDYDATAIAVGYVAAGAAGISVLTEPRHFLGSGDDLQAVRASVTVPVLRKDFICDGYQILEAAAWGADLVLLIAAALRPQEMRSLYRQALGLGMEVLAEVHDRTELEMVLPMEQAIIGVNSRNLKTLQTNLDTARSLAAHIPAERLRIAESGIKTRADLADLRQHGYQGFLIGESLLRQPDPAQALQALL